jgi:alginate O-acetyltransferase complex protein AlgI
VTLFLAHTLRPARNTVLLIASLLFYAWGGVGYSAIMVGSIIINYGLGIWIGRQQKSGSARLSLFVGIAANLAILATFKYSYFVVDNINVLLEWGGADPIAFKAIKLPLGISFFTFQAISYLVDVFRKEVQPQRNFVDLALYISFFPQLIAGPIVRYHDIARQLKERVTTWKLFSSGVERFILGLAKKVLLANTFAFVADDIFALPASQLTMSAAWLGAICYSLQIYFDFSGYSDMAIGLGRMFGFELPENFNFPYIAKSIRDFWRRWHISLSTWFRDYLYIPLGGNRKGRQRVLFNLLIVFLLTGLWHGASWTFVCWGLLHGLFMIIEKTRFGRMLENTWSPVQHSYTLLIVLLGWVLFRAENFGHAGYFFQAMFGVGEAPENIGLARMYINNEFVAASVIAILASSSFFVLVGKAGKTFFASASAKALQALSYVYAVGSTFILMALLIGSLMYLAAGTYNPFIYFRF